MGHPKSGLAVDLIKGDFGVEDDTGSGGQAAIGVNTYGYQSISLDNDAVEVPDWMVQNPDSIWVVEVVRDGEQIAIVSSDSPNATGYDQIQPADGTPQYGNAIWWRRLVPQDQFEIGDQWIVYGWNAAATGFPVAYPPMREYRP